MSTTTVIRWGIMGKQGSYHFTLSLGTILNKTLCVATGGIAKTFTRDLLIDPTTRGTTDVLHRVTAVASSSSIENAKKFISEIVTPKQREPECSAYGTYAELVRDTNVDIIYVATPHSHHYQNVMLCLEAGKSVLCEKPLTVNATQAKTLYQKALHKKLFLMEAVWTRYFPLSVAIRKHITEGDLGEVLRVYADLSTGTTPEDFDVSHRMINKDLAGGALLDLGIYSLTWVFQTLYHTLPVKQRQAPTVKGVAMTPEPRTGADEMTTMLLEFPRSSPTGQTIAHAVATTALRVGYDSDNFNNVRPAIRIEGTRGEIQVYGPSSRPFKYRFILDEGEKGASKEHEFDFPGGGHGMYWEADEAARCWRDKAVESEGISWEESTLIMSIMDEVREQGGLTYPAEIESTDYPIDLKAKGF